LYGTLYLNNFLHSSDSKVIIVLLPHPAASVFWANHEVQGRDQVFHNCLTIWQWIKRYDCKNIWNFDSVRNKRGMYVVKLHGSISYGDGATCWENAFQAFGSAKFFWRRTQTPRMGFATSVLAGSGSAQHGLPPQAKNPSYAPVESVKLRNFLHIVSLSVLPIL